MQRIPPSNICWDDTVAYVPALTCGRVIKVNAGDTITLASYQETTIPYRFLVRLRGVDCPRKESDSEGERRVATKAQSSMEELILGSVVQLRDVSFDGTGRILSAVDTYTGVDLSQWLLAQRLAVPYHGGVRAYPKCWLMYHQTGNWHQDGKTLRLVIDMMSKLRTDCDVGF
jgi:endonuclease YncB( thermonuclease family)